MLVTDLFFVSLAWWLAYLLRFHTTLFPGIQPYEFRDYLLVWPLILVIWGVVFELLDIYHPRRISTHWREFLDIFKGSCLALLVFLGLIFLLREFVLSRITVVLFWVLSVSFLNLGHVAFREGLRFLRRGGYNLRHILVIGSPIQVSQLVDRLKWHRHLGLSITGVYLTEEDASSEALGGVPVLKSQEETLELVRSGDIDQVFITLPLGEAGKLRGIRELLGDEPIAVHFVPDLTEYSTLRGNVEEFDGLHIITLQDSPFYGWNSFLKGLMDLSLGGLALILFFPLMALVALGIKVTSSGPVFFRQKRMGLEGREFDMFKFRTMVQDAEKTTGPIWAAPDDPLVSISVTPDKDPPHKLRQYGDRFNADDEHWKFLTGRDTDYVRQVGDEIFSLAAADESHTAHVVVFDRSGQHRGAYKVTDSIDYARLVQKIGEFLAESPANDALTESHPSEPSAASGSQSDESASDEPENGTGESTSTADSTSPP